MYNIVHSLRKIRAFLEILVSPPSGVRAFKSNPQYGVKLRFSRGVYEEVHALS